MILKELLADIKIHMFSDTIKAYLYNSRIIVTDCINTITDEEDLKKLNETFCIICTIGINEDTNEVEFVDTNSMTLFTQANKKEYLFLVNLIGTIIEDYKEHPKLKDLPEITDFIEM